MGALLFIAEYQAEIVIGEQGLGNRRITGEDRRQIYESLDYDYKHIEEA